MSIAGNFPSLTRFLLILLIHLGFAGIGIATTLLGVILPALSQRLILTDAESGTLFTAQFTGSLVGTFLSERLQNRIGYLSTLFIGLLILTAALPGLGWFSWQTILFCVFINGCGLGLSIPTANLLIARMNGERTAAALNILNFAWGVGAASCPSLTWFLGGKDDVRLPLVCFSILLLVIACCLLFFLKTSNIPIESTVRIPKITTTGSVWKTGFAILSLILFFLYVGSESSLSGWLTVVSARLTNLPLWILTTVFWIAFLLGRLLAPFFLRRISKRVFILKCLLIAALGALALLATVRVNFIVFGVVLLGFGLAPIFPTALAQFTEYFGEIGVQKAKWLFVSSTLGGASLTWFVGILSTASSSLQIGLYIVFISCILMIFVQLLIVRSLLITKSNIY